MDAGHPLHQGATLPRYSHHSHHSTRTAIAVGHNNSRVFVFSFFRVVICDASSQLPLNVHTTAPHSSPRQLALGFEPAKGQHTRNKDHHF